MKYLRLGQPVHIVGIAHYDDTHVYHVVKKPTKSNATYVLLQHGMTNRTLVHEHNLAIAAGPIAKVLTERRSDGFWHYALIVDKKLHLDAGCNDFFTAAQALKHWAVRCRDNYARIGSGYRMSNGKKYWRTAAAKASRDADRRLNKWSMDFTRRAERLRKAS